MTPEAFRTLALSMTGSHEEPHFERTSFRVGKKIFATLSVDGLEAMVPVHPIARCLALLKSDPATYIDHGGWTRRLGSLGLRLPMVKTKAQAKFVGELVLDAWTRIALKGKSKGKASRTR